MVRNKLGRYSIVGLYHIDYDCMFDYYGNPKVFDRLHAEYAEKAAQSALEIRARAAGELADDEAQLSPKASNLLFYSYKGDRGIDVSKEEILKLDPLTFVRVAIDGELQRRFALLHPVSHLLSELQLVFVLFVGFAALFASSLLFWSYFSPGTDLSTATPAVVTALSFFALYPLCFGYWSAEIAVITGAPVNNVGYLVVGMLILLLGILLTIMDANMRSVVGSLGRALPAILSVIGLGATSIFGVEKLRVLIGIDANVATRFSVLIGMLVIGLIQCAMLVIRY